MSRLARCFSLATLALLSACGSDPEPQTSTTAAPAPPPAATPAPAPEDSTAKMARAVGNGKPGAAVDIRYEFLGKPAVGTPTELQIALIPNAGVDALEIAVSGMPGVTVAGTLTARYTKVEAGKPSLHTVSVLPDRTGVFYLTVIAATQMGSSSLSRTFSIPFAVGNVPAQPKPAPVRDASGEAIHPMQAQEPKD